MQGETGSVLGPPPDAGARPPSYDPDWYEKIERAKQAREIGEKLQKRARDQAKSAGRPFVLGKTPGPFSGAEGRRRGFRG